MIDFYEIKTPHRWEQFAEDFFLSRGASILQRAALGADGGADLIIEESTYVDGEEKKRRTLVSCKFTTKAVGTEIEKDILDRLIQHNCVCFYGFYSTYHTLPLQNRLNKLLENSQNLIQDYFIFHDYEIEQFLKNNLENNLFKNNFEKSYSQFMGNIKKAIEQNTNFTKLSYEDIRDKKNGDYKAYFDGDIPKWRLIKKYTFKRDIFENVISHLGQKKVVLITAAGGEGKTTFLMQIGCYFFDKKYEVHYSFDGIKNLNLHELQFDKRKNYVIIIDQANYVENLLNFIEIVKLKNNILLVLASRKNEWLQSLELSKNYKDLQILIGKDEFSLSNLSKKEISSLEALLKKHGAFHESGKSLEDTIASGATSFLLATMLLATKGQKFEFYIADVVNNIRKWENGFDTLKAIGYIVACEVLGFNNREGIYCSEKLLVSLMDISQEKFYQIKRHLAAETFFQQNAKKLIHTRNPLIAQLYFNILFFSEPSELSIEDCYSDIIHQCAIQNDKLCTGIISLIPIYLKKTKKIDLARKFFKTCIDYGFFFGGFIDFIRDEVKAGNIGNYEQYSARMLCEIACEKNPTFAPFYTEWANIEIEHGELGNFEIKNSVRWIYKLGYDRKINHKGFYGNWALTELRAGNVGNIDLEEEFTARWLFRKAFHKAVDPHIAISWANLEIRETNFGNLSFEPEFSARWIFQKCLENKKVEGTDFHFSWARLEIQLNNLGDLDCKTPYSARWLLKRAYDTPILSAANLHWAKLEIRESNLGKDFDTPFTARWIMKKSLEKLGNEELKKELLIYWAKIEAQHGNYGAYQIPFSSLNLIRTLYDQALITSSGYALWSAIQYYIQIPESDDFSSNKMFEKAKHPKGKLFFNEGIYSNFEEWIKYLQDHTPEIVFKTAGFHYLDFHT